MGGCEVSGEARDPKHGVIEQGPDQFLQIVLRRGIGARDRIRQDTAAGIVKVVGESREPVV